MRRRHCPGHPCRPAANTSTSSSLDGRVFTPISGSLRLPVAEQRFSSDGVSTQVFVPFVLAASTAMTCARMPLQPMSVRATSRDAECDLELFKRARTSLSRTPDVGMLTFLATVRRFETAYRPTAFPCDVTIVSLVRASTRAKGCWEWKRCKRCLARRQRRRHGNRANAPRTKPHWREATRPALEAL